jgi:hypothetical protein
MSKEMLSNNEVKLTEYLGRYVPIRQHFVIDREGEETTRICPNQATGLVTQQGVVCGERGCHAAFPKLVYKNGQVRASGKPFFLRNS